jgi:peptidyl-dipeptidase Dcp
MSLPAENPFAAPSPLAYGLPPFDQIREEHYQPAFDEGMAEQRRQLAAITSQSEPPTLENTLEALERSGALLHRVSKVFFNLLGSDVTDGLRAIEDVVVPRLAAHRDAILMDGELFSRVNALVNGE